MMLPPEPDQPFSAQTEYFPRLNVTWRWLTKREWRPVRRGWTGVLGRGSVAPLQDGVVGYVE
jgi:hypothetical protein